MAIHRSRATIARVATKNRLSPWQFINKQRRAQIFQLAGLDERQRRGARAGAHAAHAPPRPVQKRVGRAEGEWREFKEWSLRHWKVYSTKYPGLSDQELIGKMRDAWCALKRKQTPLQK